MNQQEWERLKNQMKKHGLSTGEDRKEDFAMSEKVTKTVIRGFIRVCERSPFKDDAAMYQATGYHVAAELMQAGYLWARKNKGPEAADAQIGAILLGIFDGLQTAFGDTFTVSIKRKEKESE